LCTLEIGGDIGCIRLILEVQHTSPLHPASCDEVSLNSRILYRRIAEKLNMINLLSK
jgi:hypothetical protein